MLFAALWSLGRHSCPDWGKNTANGTLAALKGQHFVLALDLPKIPVYEALSSPKIMRCDTAPGEIDPAEPSVKADKGDSNPK